MGDLFFHFDEVYLPDMGIPDYLVGLYETCPLIDFDRALVKKSNSKLDGVSNQFISRYCIFYTLRYEFLTQPLAS